MYRPFTKLIDESLLVDIFMMFQFMLRDVSQMQPGAQDRYYDYAAKVIVKMLLRLMKKLKLKTIDNDTQNQCFEKIFGDLTTQMKLLLEFYAPDSLSIPNCMRGMAHLVFTEPVPHSYISDVGCMMMKFQKNGPVRCNNKPTRTKEHPVCMLHYPLYYWVEKKFANLSDNINDDDDKNAKQILITSTHFFSLLFFSVLISTEEYNLTNEVKGAFERMVTRLNQDNGIVKYNNDDENDENDEY